MILVRGLCAILGGVTVAAMAGALLVVALMILSDPRVLLSPAIIVFTFLLAAAAGTFMSTVAWLSFCVLFLPPVTWLTHRRGDLPNTSYLIAAALLGAGLMMLLFDLPLPSRWWLQPLLGAIGGVCIASTWRLVILDAMPSPIPIHGVHHG